MKHNDEIETIDQYAMPFKLILCAKNVIKEDKKTPMIPIKKK